MDTVLLSRLQFAYTIAFHYIFPQLTIGLGLLLVFMEGMYLRTKNPAYEVMTRFWVKVFGLCFVVGVASGVVMEFQFGTNWATYSRFVGEVFGSPLAAEGIFAFFLESTFLGLLIFGWDKVSPRWHFFSTIMVALGAHMSAVWILVANSWQQTPAGHRIVERGGQFRAEIVDFWAMVFNPSTFDRVTHTVLGTWQAGAFLVLSVGAFYLLKKRHIEFAKSSIKIALVVAAFSSIMQLVTGHQSAQVVGEYQPAKLAAFEGHYSDALEPAPSYIVGWVNEKDHKVYGIKVPGLLSFLVHGNFHEPVKGLLSFPSDERPPVGLVFQSFHLMVMIGMSLILLSMLGVVFWWTGTLFQKKWMLVLFVFSVLCPQIANQAGWISTEVGRQPWVVYGILKTADAVSKTLSFQEVLVSFIMFGIVYLLLFFVFLYLLTEMVLKGPGTSG